MLNTWILWWNTQRLPFTDAWWSPPVFFPMPGAFALSEHLAGIAIFTTPLQLAGASPLTAYNIALLLSLALSGFFTWMLVRHLLRDAGTSAQVRTYAALLAGLAFAIAPYRAGHLAHLQVLTTQWMPLAFLAMHAWMEGGRRSWLAVFALAWILQAFSNGYYLLFLPVLFALWMAWFVDWRRERTRGLALAATFAAASLTLMPALLGYVEVHRRLGLRRALTEMRMFSGELASFTKTPNMLAFWPDKYGINQETYLYPGLTALLLVAGGFMLRRVSPMRRSPVVFYAAAAFAMWWLSIGPALPEERAAAAIVRPYTLLTLLPGFDGVRAPARFAMLGYFCLAVSAGLAFARLAPAHTLGRHALALLVCAGLVVDGWMAPMPMSPPPARVMLPDTPGSAVLELPADDDRVNAAAMYRSIAHGRPLVNGYSGHTPPHYRILNKALRRGDASPLIELARRRPLVVSIHGDRDPGAHFLRVLQSVSGVQPLATTNVGRMFVIPAQPSSTIPAAGEPLTATVREVAPGTAELDLGQPRVARLLTFPLRWHYDELNTQLEIMGSEDGATWTLVRLEYTGGLAVAGALEDPQVVPMRFTLPDVRVRYLRVRPAPPWMQRELAVFGPQ